MLSQKILLRVCLNHFPILLDYGGIQRSRQYFKFENVAWSIRFCGRVGIGEIHISYCELLVLFLQVSSRH